jgi:lipopolysaccharide export system permease protein
LRFLTGFDRYLARLILVPLLGCLTVAAMLLLLDKMLKLFDFVMNEGGPVSVVWKMLGNLIPEYLSLGIPIGVLLGILLAFRGLAQSSELDALRAVGVSYNRLLRVPMAFAIFFAGISFIIVGFAEPYSRFAYERLQFELRSGALGASIKVGEFAKLAKNTTLRVEESRAHGADLRGLFVRTEGKNGQSVTVTAERGTFLSTDDPDVILLRLKNGTMVHTASTFVVPRVLTFKQQDLPVNLPAMGSFRARGDEDAELTLPELAKAARSPAASALMRTQNVASLWRRIALVAVMFVLPFLAVALAVPPKRSTSGIGVFLSIILLVVFFKTSQYGEAMGRIGAVDPVLAQVVPLAGFAALSFYLYYVLAFVPGGQPIGALDRIAARATAFVTGLFRRPVPWREATAATEPAAAAE